MSSRNVQDFSLPLSPISICVLTLIYLISFADGSLMDMTEEHVSYQKQWIEVLPLENQCLMLNFPCALFQLHYSTRSVHIYN